MGRRFEANPKTYSLRISSEAYLEIRNIFNHIAFKEHQPINAFKVFTAIRSVIGHIAQNLMAFKECEKIPTVTKIYRRANCFSWSIFYRISGEEILVLGELHQASKASRVRGLGKRK